MAIRYPSNPVDRYRDLYSRDQIDRGLVTRSSVSDYSSRTPVTGRGGTVPTSLTYTAPTNVPSTTPAPAPAPEPVNNDLSSGATPPPGTVAPAPNPGPAYGTSAAPASTTPAPAPAPPASTDIDTMFWNGLIKAGLVQGDSGYYSTGRNSIPGSEYSHAIRIALQSADAAQRRAIVDYLFSQGVAKGDRTYWYTPRGAEDESLVAAAAQLGTAAAAGGSPSGGAADSGTITGDLDALRQDRLNAVLAALETDFDMTRGTARSELQSLLNDYRMALGENTRATEQTAEQIQEQMAERGIFRSGLTAKNVATGITPYAEQLAMLNSRYSIPENATVESLIGLVGNAEGQVPLGTDIRALLHQYGLINQQEEAAKAQARVESEYSELEIELMRQLAEAGLT